MDIEVASSNILMVQQVQYMHHPDVLTLLENIPTITVVLSFPEQ